MRKIKINAQLMVNILRVQVSQCLERRQKLTKLIPYLYTSEPYFKDTLAIYLICQFNQQ